MADPSQGHSILKLYELRGEPDYLIELETLVLKIPEGKLLLEKRRKLFQRWHERGIPVRTP